MRSTTPKGEEYSYHGPVDPMELGLELEDESLHTSLSQEEDMDMMPFGRSNDAEGSEVRDIRRRGFIVHAPSVGLILTSLAALATGALIGGFTSGLRGGDTGVDNESSPLTSPADTPDDASRPTGFLPFDGLSSNSYPPLADLVQNNEIVGDVSWELDFAIVGFPKVSRQ